MNNGRSGLYWIALMATVCLVAAYIMERDFQSVYFKYQESAGNVRAREEERRRLALEEQALATKLAGLATDSFIQEKEFREAGFVLPGETIYEVVLPATSTQ